MHRAGDAQISYRKRAKITQQTIRGLIPPIYDRLKTVLFASFVTLKVGAFIIVSSDASQLTLENYNIPNLGAIFLRLEN